jgi:hypothetical protein
MLGLLLLEILDFQNMRDLSLVPNQERLTIRLFHTQDEIARSLDCDLL